MKNILFLGGGNMAEAMIKGMLGRGFNKNQIYVVDRNKEKQAAFVTLGVYSGEKAEEFLEIADILILAVKPQSAKLLCHSIADLLKNTDKTVISIMAGISIEILQNWLGQHLAVIRAMPNTAAKMQASATALFTPRKISAEIRQQVEAIMLAIGTFAWLDTENQMNAVTALCGSGPAYFIYFTECMINTAIKLGLAPELAEMLAIQTLRGAAALACESDGNIALERKRITSNKGTTEAALNSLREYGLENMIEKAMQAADSRAKTLGYVIN